MAEKKTTIKPAMIHLPFYLGNILLFALIAGTAAAQEIGAEIPFTTYEAESGLTNGILHSGSDDRSRVSYEASGRGVVELKDPDSYVAFRSTAGADRITIRYSIPKGTEGAVSLFVNNVKKKDISLSSRRIWNENPRVPGGFFRFFDEVIIDENVSHGDEIRLVKGNAEPAPVIIDLIDLEQTPPPLEKPDDTWFDITACGATGNDESDDTEAIRDCIAAASTGTKKVWIPAGNYYISDQISISKGIQVAGAGMWHSVIKKNIPAANRKRAFQMEDSTAVKNLKIEDVLGNVRINNHEGIRFSATSGVLIDGVWVANTFGAGILGANAGHAVIRNCRLTGTYADAIHIARQSVNILAQNNFVRNSGDDGLAIVTYDSTGCHDIVFRNNTVWFNYWGRGITLIGGDRNILENNLVIDGGRAGLLIAVEEYNGKITPYVTNFVVQNNRVVRCGDITTPNRGGISLWGNVETSRMSGAVRNNEIIDPIYHALVATNWVPKEVIIQNNTIGAPVNTGGRRFYTPLKEGYAPVLRDNPEISGKK